MNSVASKISTLKTGLNRSVRKYREPSSDIHARLNGCPRYRYARLYVRTASFCLSKSGTHLPCSRGSQQPAKTGPVSFTARVPEHEGRAHVFVERRGQGNAGLRSGRRYAGGGNTSSRQRNSRSWRAREMCPCVPDSEPRYMYWRYVPSSETNRRSNGWMLVRTLACARMGRSAGKVMVANRSLGNPTDRDDNGGLWNRMRHGSRIEAAWETERLATVPYPTVRARRISIQTTRDSYVPNVARIETRTANQARIVRTLEFAGANKRHDGGNGPNLSTPFISIAQNQSNNA